MRIFINLIALIICVFIVFLFASAYKVNNNLSQQVNKLSDDLDLKQIQIKKLSNESTAKQISIDKLELKMEELTQVNNDLSEKLEEYSNPEKLFLRADAALFDKNYEEALSVFNEVAKKYPCSEYAAQATQKADDIAVLMRKERARLEREAEFRKAGFKGIKPVSFFNSEHTSVTVKAAKKGKQWIFDRYDDTYIYFDADKDADYYVLDVNIKSDEKDPALPSFYVGVVGDSGALTDITLMRYNFYRWEDYGTYLGNYADSRNNFEKNDFVSFTVGAQLPQKTTGGKTVVVFSDKQECHTRSSDRFSTPPISYTPSYCARIQGDAGPENFADVYVPLKIFQ